MERKTALTILCLIALAPTFAHATPPENRPPDNRPPDNRPPDNRPPDNRPPVCPGASCADKDRDHPSHHAPSGGRAAADSASQSNATSHSSSDARATGGSSNQSQSAYGGNASASAVGAGNTTNVSSTTIEKRVHIPMLFNPLPPTVSTGGGLETRVLSCGPLLQVKKTDVKGTIVGFFSSTAVDLGEHMELVPMLDRSGAQVYYTEQKFSDGSTRFFGSQAVVTSGLPNVAGARTLSIGIAGGSAGGSGGGGVSSSMQRIVTTVTLLPCELPGAYKIVREKVVSGITPEELRAALQETLKLGVTARVTVPERRWVPCPPDGCRAPKHGYYVYDERKAEAHAESKANAKVTRPDRQR